MFTTKFSINCNRKFGRREGKITKQCHTSLSFEINQGASAAYKIHSSRPIAIPREANHVLAANRNHMENRRHRSDMLFKCDMQEEEVRRKSKRKGPFASAAWPCAINNFQK